MSDELPPDCCDDESTWRHKGEKIDLPRLLQLIEENGGPFGLDLHGCDMGGIDARPETLRLHLPDYRSQHGQDARPPWLNAAAEAGINLCDAHLEQAHLAQAQLRHANLMHAHLETANLSHARLENANLWGADLQNANLIYAHLENADLPVAHLEGADLSGAHLENANLLAARGDGAFWYGSYLDHTRVRRGSLGPAIGDELAARGQVVAFGAFQTAREVYLTLKTNFDSIGRYDDASWAYVKERQMEKAMYFPTTAGHRWIRERMASAMPPPRWGPTRLPRWLWWKLRSAFFHCRLFVGRCPSDIKSQMRNDKRERQEEHLDRPRWLLNWCYEATCGHGEKPWRPLLWAAALSVVAFPLLYWATGALPGHGPAFTSGSPSNIDWAGWGDSIIFSLASFATLAFNRLQPDGALANILAASEAAIGVLTFALFVFTLGNRMRRS